jgi:hypothetical protein
VFGTLYKLGEYNYQEKLDKDSIHEGNHHKPKNLNMTKGRLVKNNTNLPNVKQNI